MSKMRENSRIIKLHSVIKYKAYTALLEGRISKREYDILAEAGLGIMDKIGTFFGAGKDAAKEMSGNLIDMIKNRAYSKQFELAKTNITKSVEEIRAIAKKAGNDDKVVHEFIAEILRGIDITPADIAAKPADGGKPGEEAAPGTPVSAETIKNDPAALADVISNVTGKPTAQVAAELEQKKPDIAAISLVLGNVIGKSEGVDQGIATKIVKALINKGHLKLEGRKNLTRSGLLNFINEVKNANSHREVMDRWLQLAGLNSVIISEGRSGDILADIKAKTIKTPEELEARIKQATTDGKGEFVLKRKDEIMAAFKTANPDVNPAEEKKIDAALEVAGKDATPGGKEASPEDQRKAEETKKKCAAELKDVKIDVPEASEDDILKVISAINASKSLKVGS